MNNHMPDPARLHSAHDLARRFYRHQLAQTDGPRRYLTDRGLGTFTTGSDEPWYLGYAPAGWTALVDHLTHAGYTAEELLAAGLTTCSRTGRLIDLFRDRVMFPIHHAEGAPTAFIGRAAPGAHPGTPKYLNTPDTAIYHKGQTLYGVGEQATQIAAGAAPALVEGPIDVLAIALADEQRIGIAACGTSLTAHHAAAIAALPGARHGVTTALDNDDAGRAATVRAWQHLATHEDLDLHAATLPAGSDPGDLIATARGMATLRAALIHTQPLAQAVIDIRLNMLIARHPDLLRWPESRIQAARALAATIAELPSDQVLVLSNHIAARTQTSLATVAEAVIDHLERPPPDHTPAGAFAAPVAGRPPQRLDQDQRLPATMRDSAARRGGTERSHQR